ncbi:hypothetical protein [Kitasatospora griseola]|uniref:hypothetical protein n=1 Tax=Kitasatospora griseola TaxID=2064 RepID=UPI0038279AC1
MTAWIEGFSDLAYEIMPFDGFGNLRPLGVYASGSPGTEIIWAPRRDDLPDVFFLADESLPSAREYRGIFHAPPGWGPGGRRQEMATGDSIWRWSRDDIRGSLKSSFEGRRLKSRKGGAVYRERMWNLAHAVIGRSVGVLHKPLDPESVKDGLVHILRALEGMPQKPFVLIDRTYYRASDINDLHEICERLNLNGERLKRPAPAPDQEFGPGSGFVWEVYSPNRLLELVEFVWREALVAYGELVADNLPKFGRTMGIMALGRQRVRGELVISEKPGWEGGPIFNFVIDSASPDLDLDELPPVYPGEPFVAPDISIELVCEPEADGFYLEMSRSGGKRASLMPKGSMAATYARPGGSSTALDVFDASPVTDLAYSWLAADLVRLGWAQALWR